MSLKVVYMYPSMVLFRVQWYTIITLSNSVLRFVDLIYSIPILYRQINQKADISSLCYSFIRTIPFVNLVQLVLC